MPWGFVECRFCAAGLGWDLGLHFSPVQRCCWSGGHTLRRGEGIVGCFVQFLQMVDLGVGLICMTCAQL